MDDQTKGPPQPPAQGQSKRFLFGVLIALLTGILIATVATGVTQSMLPETGLLRKLAESRKIMTAWDVLTLLVIIMLVLGTHEIGHLLGGVSQRMKFALLIVEPFG